MKMLWNKRIYFVWVLYEKQQGEYTMSICHVKRFIERLVIYRKTYQKWTEDPEVK